MSRYISKSVNVGMGGGVTTQTISEESKNGYYTIDEAERILGLRFRPELKKFLTNTPKEPVGFLEFADLSKDGNFSAVQETLSWRKQSIEGWYFFDANWVVIDCGDGGGNNTIFDNRTGDIGMYYHDDEPSFSDIPVKNIQAWVKWTYVKAEEMENYRKDIGYYDKKK